MILEYGQGLSILNTWDNALFTKPFKLFVYVMDYHVINTEMAESNVYMLVGSE